MTTESPYLTIAEAASYLRVSLRTAYGLAERGELPTVRVGGQYRILRDELAEWLDASRRDKATP